MEKIQTRSAALVFAIFFVCIALTAFIYYPGLEGGYYFDDSHVLKNNPHIRVESLDTFSLIRAANSFTAGGRELSMLSFALNHYFFGDSTWWYKFINLVIHCFNGLGLILLARQLVGTHPSSLELENGPQFYNYIPILVVALWLVHPINLNPVLYISQRMALLSSFFIIYGLVVYIWARVNIKTTARKLVYLALILLVFTSLGYYSKENGVLLPVYAFLVECTLLKFCTDGQRDRVVMAMFAVGAAAVLILISYQF